MPEEKRMQDELTLLRQLSDSRENRAKIILQKDFIRKRVADKQTLAERCNIGVQGTNRWETLLLKSLSETNAN